jgi:hypothetical protein
MAAATRPLPATDVMAPGGQPPVAPPPAPPPVAPPPGQPPITASLVSTAGSDRCQACNAPLAPDQRYCLECGERRGQARFAAAPPARSVTTTTMTTGGPAPSGSRFSPGATLIAGVATLLLAMGIGVLIGDRSGSNQTASSPKVQVVNVGGGSGAAAAASTAASTNSTPASGKSGKSSAKKAAKSNISNSNNNAFGGVKTVQKLPPPTVTVGQTGTGAGYQHGHFTGNFFGGG